MLDTVSTSPVLLAIHCRRCGYDLRTLPRDANCPECGLPIEESTRIDRMVDAPRNWVNTQRIGMWILFLSYLLWAVAILGEVFLPYIQIFPRPFFLALRTAPLLLLALAVWLLTSQRNDRRIKKSSLLVRWGFVGVLALSLLLPGAEHAGFNSIWGKLGWTLFYALLVTCWIGLGCIQIRIARMLAAQSLSPLIWGASILWSLCLLSAATFYLFRKYTGESLFLRSETPFVAILLIGGLMLVMSSLWVAVRFQSSRHDGSRG